MCVHVCGVASWLLRTRVHAWVHVHVCGVAGVATPHTCTPMCVHTCVKSICLAHIMYIHHTPIYVHVHVCRDQHTYMFAEE